MGNCVLSLVYDVVVGVLSSLETRERGLAVSLLHLVVHWSAICDCDVSWSYSLALRLMFTHLSFEIYLFYFLVLQCLMRVAQLVINNYSTL